MFSSVHEEAASFFVVAPISQVTGDLAAAWAGVMQHTEPDSEILMQDQGGLLWQRKC